MITFPVLAFTSAWIAGMTCIVLIMAYFFDDASPFYSAYVFENLVVFMSFVVAVSSIESVFRTMVNGYFTLRMRELSTAAFVKDKELQRNSITVIESRGPTGSVSVKNAVTNASSAQQQEDAPSAQQHEDASSAQGASSAGEDASSAQQPDSQQLDSTVISPQSDTGSAINTPSFGEPDDAAIKKAPDSDALSGANTVSGSV